MITRMHICVYGCVYDYRSYKCIFVCICGRHKGKKNMNRELLCGLLETGWSYQLQIENPETTVWLQLITSDQSARRADGSSGLNAGLMHGEVCFTLTSEAGKKLSLFKTVRPRKCPTTGGRLASEFNWLDVPLTLPCGFKRSVLCIVYQFKCPSHS